jgi:hypothetical protein
MSTEWRKSILILWHKNKEDVQNCANYRRIKLMSYTIKFWDRVIEHKLKDIVKISDNQLGFIFKRSTTEVIHLLRQMIKYSRERKNDLHIIFIDLEKSYNKVPKEVL